MSKSVSIVIPVFNASGTINETLTSVAAELKRHPDIVFETIAIDDGSTDSSMELLTEWASRMPLKIRSLAHSGGPAEPRNEGIQLSTSDYLFFLDADDVLLPEGLSSALDFAYEIGSDLVVCKLKSLDGRGAPRGMHKGNQAKVTLGDSRIYWSLNPMKIFRRELIVENDLKFDTLLGRDEDQPFVFSAMLNAKKISVFSEPPVVGIRYNNSGTNLTLRPYPIIDLVNYLEKMSSLLNSIGDPISRKRLAIRHWEIEISREMFWKRLHNNSEADFHELMDYLEQFKKDFLEVELLPQISIRWRSIVRLINNDDRDTLLKIVKFRGKALTSKSFLARKYLAFRANLVRLRFTFVN